MGPAYEPIPIGKNDFSKYFLEDQHVKRGTLAALILVLGAWHTVQMRSVAHYGLVATIDQTPS